MMEERFTELLLVDKGKNCKINAKCLKMSDNVGKCLILHSRIFN